MNKQLVRKADQERENLRQKEDQLKKIIFASTEGRELLEIWKETHLINFPCDYEGQDLFNLGKVEGKKAFVRSLVIFMKHAAEGTV